MDSQVAAGARLRFGKDRRVLRRGEFLRIQGNGRKRHTPSFVILATTQSTPGPSRFGFSVSRKVGNAVVRNLLKRRLREFVRTTVAPSSTGRNFVVIAKPQAAGLPYVRVAAELEGPLRA